MRVLLLLVALIATQGCAEDAWEPDPSVSLTLTTEFAPLSPAVKAVVQNRGTLPVLTNTCPPFSRFTLLDEQGNRLNVRNPCGAEPASPCPLHHTIEAQQTMTLYLPLPGEHWPAEGCESVPMTPGRYTVTFRLPFRWNAGPVGDHEVVREIAFDWPLPVSSE